VIQEEKHQENPCEIGGGGEEKDKLHIVKNLNYFYHKRLVAEVFHYCSASLHSFDIMKLCK
jgi:hypothetical protein